MKAKIDPNDTTMTKSGSFDLDVDPVSRRDLLLASAAVGATALFPKLRAAAQSAGRDPRRIDVHHHFTPEPYNAFRRQYNQGGAPVTWELSQDLEDMDRAGVATAILSITTPGFWFGNTDDVRRVSRECNEAAAELRSDHRGRFGSFATIPMTDPDGALRELEYALDTLNADGVGLFSNYEHNKWLGDPIFDPIWQELNRRRAVVYVHPAPADCCRNINQGVPATWIEYGADTGRTIASLILSGTTSRYPEITFIFSHGGGVVPFVVERFLGGTAEEIVPGIVTKGQGGTGVVGSNYREAVPRGTLYELRKMYYDTAQASNPVALQAIKQVAGTSQIVFGTDYWFRTAVETARGLDTSRVFTNDELVAINRGNAERILPRYGA